MRGHGIVTSPDAQEDPGNGAIAVPDDAKKPSPCIESGVLKDGGGVACFRRAQKTLRELSNAPKCPV